MPDFEYIPTPFDLSERAYDIAQSENLLESFAACTVSRKAKSTNVCILSISAYFRKPGELSEDLTKAKLVYVSGKLTNHEELFAQFEEKVQELLNAYHTVAA